MLNELNETNQLAQQMAAKAYADQCSKAYLGIGNENNAKNVCEEHLPSPAKEAEKRAYSLAREADKARQAAEFLRAHPEFDEFIQLIRKGVIGI